jgi:hypothetical protein
MSKLDMSVEEIRVILQRRTEMLQRLLVLDAPPQMIERQEQLIEEARERLMFVETFGTRPEEPVA